MATVWIPPLLRDLTGGQEIVSVAGSTVRQLLDGLEQQFPGIKGRLCTEDSLRPGVAVVVDGIASPIGLLQSVRPDSEVHFLPAIAGGSLGFQRYSLPPRLTHGNGVTTSTGLVEIFSPRMPSKIEP